MVFFSAFGVVMSNKFINSALEIGNYSLALKLASEEQRKKPTSLNNVQTINILAHLDPKKAILQLDEIVKETPSDPNTLKLIIETYELLDTKAPDVFENATRKYGSGMLILEWNNYSLSRSEYLSFQKSSMLLKKLIGTKIDEKTQAVRFRAVASIVIACKSVGVLRLDQSKRKLLSMIGLKLVEESELHDSQLDSHQMFLKAQLLLIKGDLDSVIGSLDVFLERERDLELLLIYFDTLKQLKKWEKLLEQCKKYLVDVDDWDTWKLCILSAKNLNKLDDFQKFINEYKVGRNSTIAKIEVEQSQEGKLNAISKYLRIYMHKPCCFQDLKLVISTLPSEKVMCIIQEQFNIIYSNGKTGNELVVLVNYMKFKATLTKDIMKTPEFVNECWKYYKQTSHLLSSLPEYDFHSGYELIIMIIQSIILQNKNFNSQLVLKLIVILEWALKENKFEFHLKLWLINLYKLVSQPALAIEQHNDMKIKNLQLDTIGVQTLINCSTISSSIIGFLPLQTNEATSINDLIASCSKIYSNNVEREIYPSIMQCLDDEIWQKIGSFMDFQNRLRHSLSKYYITLIQLQMARFKGDQLDGYKLMDKLNILKDLYRRSQVDNIDKDLNVDTDVKVNNNLDMKTIWDCGTHEPINEIGDKLMFINIEKVKIMAMVQLVVYEPTSLIWDDLIGELKNANLEGEFSEIEQWSIRSLISLLSGNAEKLKLLPSPPSDIISWKFNTYYSTLLDFTKLLDLVIKTPRKGLAMKDIKKQRKIIGETIRRVFSKSSDLKRDVRIEFKAQFEHVSKWCQEETPIQKNDVNLVALKFGVEL